MSQNNQWVLFGGQAVPASGPLLANYGYTAASVHTQTQTNANQVCIGALAIQIQGSSNLRIDVHAVFGSGTTGKSVNHLLYAIPFTNPASRFSGSTAVGGALGSGYPNQTLSQWMAFLASDATGTTANGLKFNGVSLVSTAPGAIQLYNRQQDSLTGLLNQGDMSFDYSSVLVGGGFTVGQTVVIALVLSSTSGGDVVTYGTSPWISVDER